MINTFKLKKFAALIFTGMFTVILFFVGLQMYGFLYSFAFMLGGLIISIIIANFMLKNPFTDMIEGKGILVLNFDSTGIIKPFIVAVQSPYIKGKFNKQQVKDVFDREAVFHLAAPNKTMSPLIQGEEGITIKLDEQEYNKGRFALFHYPCLIWNDQIKSILTKDILSTQEKDAFAEHGILYLNRKMEELTSVVRDFGRYVVELTKPKESFIGSKWFYIILVGGLILIAAIFAPAIWEQLVSGFGASDGAIEAIKSNSGGAITPK